MPPDLMTSLLPIAFIDHLAVRRAWAGSLLALALAGCAVAPVQTAPPAMDLPAAFKHGGGEWRPVASTPVPAGGAWWRAFDDPVLDGLTQRVEVSNQVLAAAVATYAQARAAVAEQRASLFPVVTGGLGADRSGGSGRSSVSGASGGTGDSSSRRSYDLSVGLSWEPDLWGRLGQAVTAATASEQASAADLAAARLSLQGELAINYFNLRGLDEERALLRQIVDGQARTLQIARNRYDAGIAARTDVLQAETQLANTRAELVSLERQRSQLEHAIAVLVGQAPASFVLEDRAAAVPPPVDTGGVRPEATQAPRDVAAIPVIPADLPSTLLLRRPDIVAAERRVALANAQFGVARTAWFPSLRLTGSAGLGAASVADLFSASNLVWALGLSLAQTIFDGGAIAARTEGARAGLDQSAARYRQTVLTAFQSVEDQLVAQRLLREQQALREQAARAAALAEQQVMNRYQAGQVSFSEVITAQSTAQNARRSLVQLQADRRVAAVTLVQALGGGWQQQP